MPQAQKSTASSCKYVPSSEWVLLHSGPEGVVIKDMGSDSGLSVTNDAENVVRKLVLGLPLGNRRLFYFDSVGRLDEICVEGGKFAGFALGGSPEIRALLQAEGLL